MFLRFIAAFLLLLTSLSALAQQRVTGEILVQAKPGVTAQQIEQELQHEFGWLPQLKVSASVSDIMRVHVVSFDESNLPITELLRFANHSSTIQVAQVNHMVSERITPNDPSYTQQWFHNDAEDNDIDTDLAWDITTGGTTAFGDEIVACVVETGGAKWNQEDLIDNHWTNIHEIAGNGVDDDNNGYIDDVNGWNMASSNDVIVAANHGTQVSSMIGAKGNNNLGITGVNWNVKIMQVQMGGITEANVIAAYSYPLKMRKLYNQSNGASGAYVVVTNSSWGTDNGQAANAPLWCAMYDSLGTYGILSCAATANNNVNIDVVGDLPTTCPSNYLLSVTATNNSDVRTFSGYGTTNIDLGAPGEAVYLAGANSYGNTSGTSFASPCVAGAVALLYSAPCNSFMSIAHSSPATGADLIRQYILDGVDPVSNLQSEVLTGGRLNVRTSLDLLINACSNGGCVSPFAVQITQQPNTLNYTIAWNTIAEVTSVNVQYRPLGTTTWATVSNVMGNEITLDALLTCTTYEFQLASVCTSGTADWTSSYTFTTDGCCVNPNQYVVTSITPTTADIAWESILAASGYNIQWTNGINSGNMEVGSNTFSLTGLDSCSTYTVSVSSICVNPEVPPTSVIFSTTGCGTCTDLTYCDAFANDATAEYIQSVSVGSFTNTSTDNSGYTDYTSVPTLTLHATQSYDVTLVPGFPGTSYYEYFKIWIDYNGNGNFDEPQELAYNQGTGSNTTTTGTITIPAGIATGSVKMRVGMSYVGLFNTGAQPVACGTYDYGEVEDYCVTLDPTIGVFDLNSNESFAVYPNPTENQLSLSVPSTENQFTVQVFNANGQQVTLEKNVRTLSTHDWNAGVYFVQITTEKYTYRTKVIKQ